MSNQRYPEEFKIEAVKQVTDRGLPVAEATSPHFQQHPALESGSKCSCF